MSQNPDPSIGPSPEHCRYTAMAAGAGATEATPQAANSRSALETNNAGTNTDGGTRRSILELNSTNSIDTADEAMTMAGNEVTLSCAR